MNDEHTKLVEDISKKVRNFYDKGIPFRIYRGSTNLTRVISFEKDRMVDVSNLNHVLSVNTKLRTVIVEPNVAMDALAAATLKKGLIPPVVMEFPGITVGGGIQGGAGESSSYKWGTFNRIINWYDILLADGEVIRASREKHQDLFWGAAGAYGSFGIIVAAEVQLIPAERYVALEYIPVNSFDEALRSIKQEADKHPDFIDGIMFSQNSGVILVGNMKSDVPLREQTFSKAHNEWFYLHAEKVAGTHRRQTEKVPINDYLFRYDRGAFWMGKAAFDRLHMPFNRFTRWLLNRLMHTRRMYTALQASGFSQEFIIQDLAIPEAKAVDFMNYVDHKLGIYPLWICPLLKDDKSPLMSSYLNTPVVINVGVWGRCHGTYKDFVKANCDLEAYVYKLGGKKWLYAHAYYSEKQFWNIYGGRKWYDDLRKKYRATSLPTVYEKVIVTDRYKISAKRGITFAILGLNGIKRI